MTPLITDHLPVGIRAFATRQFRELKEPSEAKHRPPIAPASEWTLIFDTETATDAGQALRFGTYQLRKAGELSEAGILFDPAGITPDELATLSGYAETHQLALVTREQFVDQVFFAGGKFPYALMDWVSDELVNGRIRLFPLSDNQCRKQLLQLGLPQNDHKWVRLAVGCGGRKLVSQDVDFFDPSKKGASAAVKEALRKNRRGACCKALKRQFGVEVMCLEHVPDDIAN